jgi:hypothetical protein
VLVAWEPVAMGIGAMSGLRGMKPAGHELRFRSSARFYRVERRR